MRTHDIVMRSIYAAMTRMPNKVRAILTLEDRYSPLEPIVGTRSPCDKSLASRLRRLFSRDALIVSRH